MIPIKQLLTTGAKFCQKNASTILSIAAAGGVIATGYLGVKAGMDIAYDISDAGGPEDVAPKEKAKIILKDAAPSIAVGGLTIAAIISSRVIDIRRARAMAASYALLAESSEVYRRKVIEKLGEKKDNEVLGEIAEEEFKDVTDGKDIQAIQTLGGQYLFKDEVTKQYFRADVDFVRKMQNKVNKFYGQGENFVTISDWLGYLGLEEPIYPLGTLGWPASCGIEFDLPAVICPNGEPGYLVKYKYEPMTEEEGETYDMNHYISSTYE